MTSWRCIECGNTSPEQPHGETPVCLKTALHKSKQRVEMEEVNDATD